LSFRKITTVGHYSAFVNSSLQKNSSLEITRQESPPDLSTAEAVGWYVIELSAWTGQEVIVGWIDHGNRSELALLIPVAVHSLFVTK
jgi:hypothetical protein